ncbi:hypothetical protein JL720_17184 [Aureococcus anophagefferens]|nr:hypothetical protein JL720_17184 [Aureococcus anophagefferens]
MINFAPRDGARAAAKMCNFIEWRADKKIVYSYASLFFICCGDRRRNGAAALSLLA